MAFHYLTNVDLEQAKQEYISRMLQQEMHGKTEIIFTGNCNGRITAEAVYAKICAPHYHASAMDGIAVKAADTFGATDTSPVHLKKGSYREIDTGDPIPEEYDAVVMIEDVVREEDGVCLYDSAVPWQHIRQIGEDLCAGEMILSSYQKITPAAIGALIAGGVLQVKVIKKPVVGIIPTGDEIIEPTDDPKPGDILEFNGSIFSAMLSEWGAEPVLYPIVPDQFDKITEMVERALTDCDLVLLNAGSSAGREDLSYSVIQKVGEVLYHGIAMKPGKPAILGYRKEKPILGIPGYPVSGILVLEQFVKPLLDVWFCQAAREEPCEEAILSRRIVSGLKYREFIRVRLGYVGKQLIATPLNRGSGVISSFMKADGILEVPQNQEGIEAGSKVKVRLLKERQELENALIVTGSHDPLLDELADLIHRADPFLSMSSSHVGSMGGIMAAKRGENHVAGIHLLEETDGTYNESYLRRYFPNGGVYLVECVGRTQGLMVAAGNPHQILQVKDLLRRNIRYVNRQKGSGTRILIDYLCKKEKIDSSHIYGYDREEFTHTSVAAQIAAGSADAGMGIYSAAKLYGLDFIPICNEQYDLLITEEAWNTPGVQKLLEILKGEEFRERLTKLGGYLLDQPGRIRRHFYKEYGDEAD